MTSSISLHVFVLFAVVVVIFPFFLCRVSHRTWLSLVGQVTG